MEFESDGIKDCFKKLSHLESKCISQQHVIDTLTKEISYLQEKSKAQEIMLHNAFSYVKELEQKFNLLLLKE
jgi:hypothetical protein